MEHVLRLLSHCCKLYNHTDLMYIGSELNFGSLGSASPTMHNAAFSPPAGVSQISFWPGDPELSMLRPGSANHSSSRGAPGCISEEAALDAVATEKLKSNSRPHICVLLQPLAQGLAQFVDETSRGSDFIERMSDDEPGLNTEELFNGYQSLASQCLKAKCCRVAPKTFPPASQRADETPESLLQKTADQDARAAPGHFDPHGPGELLRGAVLLQPEAQHEGAGGGPGGGGGRRATARLRLPQVRKTLAGPSACLQGRWAGRSRLTVSLLAQPGSSIPPRSSHRPSPPRPPASRCCPRKGLAIASSKPGCWLTEQVGLCFFFSVCHATRVRSH